LENNIFFKTGLSLEPYAPVLFLMATSKPFNESLETVVKKYKTEIIKTTINQTQETGV